MSRGPNGGSPFNLNADEFSQLDVNKRRWNVDFEGTTNKSKLWYNNGDYDKVQLPASFEEQFEALTKFRGRQFLLCQL